MKCVNVITIYLISVIKADLLNLEEGAKCKSVNDKEWICHALSVCPQIGDFKKSRPDICGFRGKEPIICCPTDDGLDKPSVTMHPMESTTAKENEVSDIVLNSPNSSSAPSAGPPLAILKCIEYEVKLCHINPAFEQKPKQGDRVARDASPTQTELHKSSAKGRPAASEQFPFMAAIGYGEENTIIWGCEGTVVSEMWVLSAAHCVQSVSGRAGWVGLSGVEMTPDFRGLTIPIEQIVVHPLYKSPAIYHDIALFQHEYNLLFNPFVQPACLHSLKVLPRAATAAGWGTDSLRGEKSLKLFYTAMKTTDSQTCQDNYNKSNILPWGYDNEIMFCAEETEKDSCSGDSGGPLFYNSTLCLQVQLGIASFRRNCGVNPGVYTRISYYVPWIQAIIWKSSGKENEYSVI